MVYADIIQGVGAVPLDVRQIGVDFCCAGTYKWLMGDFGVAFLYAKPESLAQLRRPEIGWRGLTSYTSHFLPYDAPGAAGGEWTLGTEAGEIFEVGTPDWCALEVAAAAMAYLRTVGVSNIARYRAPLLDVLQADLPRVGFLPLTPREGEGPFVVFAREGARERYARRPRRGANLRHAGQESHQDFRVRLQRSERDGAPHSAVEAVRAGRPATGVPNCDTLFRKTVGSGLKRGRDR